MQTIGAIGEVEEIENVWIPMADGCRIAARIWLPRSARSAPVPAILECIPYRKRDFTRGRDEPIHGYFARNGYAAVRVDLRGSGDSDGVLSDEYSWQEHEDALEIIAWIARQPWCSRRGRHDGHLLGRLQLAPGRGPAARPRSKRSSRSARPTTAMPTTPTTWAAAC